MTRNISELPFCQVELLPLTQHSPSTIRTKKATIRPEGSSHNTLQNIFLDFNIPCIPLKRKWQQTIFVYYPVGVLSEWVTYLLLFPWKADRSIRPSYHWKDRQRHASGSSKTNLGWHRTRKENRTKKKKKQSSQAERAQWLTRVIPALEKLRQLQSETLSQNKVKQSHRWRWGRLPRKTK